MQPPQPLALRALSILMIHCSDPTRCAECDKPAAHLVKAHNSGQHMSTKCAWVIPYTVTGREHLGSEHSIHRRWRENITEHAQVIDFK